MLSGHDFMTNCVIIGAGFGTGNRGVSALAWSSIAGIKHKRPDTVIDLVGQGRLPGTSTLILNGKSEILKTWPIRFCPNIFATHHLIRLYASVALCRMFSLLKRRWAKNESTLGALLRADVMCDITGGDSFSDIYGLGRLFRGYLVKCLCMMTGSPFVLLPQTYGPFKSRWARWMARSILSKASAIYARDKQSLDLVCQLMHGRAMRTMPQLCPDVAFVLDAIAPQTQQREQIEQLKNQGHSLIGLNVSGLLYNGGYTQNNMFGLAGDYIQMCQKIIERFAGEGAYVLLTPHVIPQDMPVEDDLQACRSIFAELPEPIQKKVLLLDAGYDQNEIKYMIGLCDFFMGARMHATIAALSQCVPAVGMAYSKKFRGVFETAGVEDCVLDMCMLDTMELLTQIDCLFQNRNAIRGRLSERIPMLKENILEIFAKIGYLKNTDVKSH